MLHYPSFAYKMAFKFCIPLAWFALFLAPGALFGQVDDANVSELLENFFRDNENGSEADVQEFLENLENLRAHPLDINRATREELQSLQLLNALQVESFLAYRERFGPLLTDYELQAVPNWDLTDIRRLSPYLTTKNTLDKRSRPLIQGLYRGDNEIIMRWSRPLPPSYTRGVEGEPYGYALRFRHTFDNRMRFGFTAENDPGEAFFNKSNRHGFDFYSAHLFLQNLNRTVRVVALGDYSARFGQGLLLLTGFATGKSAESLNVIRSGRKLNAYGSFGETFFLRGGATTLAFGKHWEFTALVSHRGRDGNLAEPGDVDDLEDPEIAFSTLQTSGLHRTKSEVEDENAVRETIGGVSVSYQGRNGQVSLNGVHTAYNKSLELPDDAYRAFNFSGKTLTGLSLDYNWRYRNALFFGETAQSDNGGLASVNGLLVGAERRVTFVVVNRYLERDYQSIYSRAFAEVTKPANEYGTYLGVQIRPSKKWQIDAYADGWRHPWLRYNVSGPSSGREYQVRLQWTRSKTFSANMVWFSETKERDSNVEGLVGLLENQRDRFRIHVNYKVSPGLELRSRVEWTSARVDNQDRQYGFMAFQEAIFKPKNAPLSGVVRYSLFDTQSFDSRVFVFENDLFSAISIPAFSGRGARYFVNLTWRANDWLKLEARFEQTVKTLAVTTSGEEGKRTIWKLQARMNF